MRIRVNSRLMNMIRRFITLEQQEVSVDDRVIEYSFVISKLLSMPKGKVLDVGCAERSNIIPAILTSLGWEVWGIDIRKFKYEHPNFQFIRSDVRKTDFPNNFFDYVYAVSTIEHIGLSGRYGVTEEIPLGDAEAVSEVRRILRDGGTFLVTVPYGQRTVIKPLHRVYDGTQLEVLFSNWLIKSELYYASKEGFLLPVPEHIAVEIDPRKVQYALALLELVKK